MLLWDPSRLYYPRQRLNVDVGEKPKPDFTPWHEVFSKNPQTQHTSSMSWHLYICHRDTVALRKQPRTERVLQNIPGSSHRKALPPLSLPAFTIRWEGVCERKSCRSLLWSWGNAHSVSVSISGNGRGLVGNEERDTEQLWCCWIEGKAIILECTELSLSRLRLRINNKWKHQKPGTLFTKPLSCRRRNLVDYSWGRSLKG